MIPQIPQLDTARIILLVNSSSLIPFLPHSDDTLNIPPHSSWESLKGKCLLHDERISAANEITEIFIHLADSAHDLALCETTQDMEEHQALSL